MGGSVTATEPAPAPTKSLFVRIGGADAVEAAVEKFYSRMVADPGLAKFFAGVDLRRLKTHQRLFLTFAFSGGDKGKAYTPDDLKARHKRIIEELGCNETHFDMVAGHLVATLNELGVPEDLVGEVVAIVGPLRPIFEQTS